MKVHEGFAGIFDRKGELYGIEDATVASITASQMTVESRGKRKYEARPLTIIEGDLVETAANALIAALIERKSAR